MATRLRFSKTESRIIPVFREAAPLFELRKAAGRQTEENAMLENKTAAHGRKFEELRQPAAGIESRSKVAALACGELRKSLAGPTDPHAKPDATLSKFAPPRCSSSSTHRYVVLQKSPPTTSAPYRIGKGLSDFRPSLYPHLIGLAVRLKLTYIRPSSPREREITAVSSPYRPISAECWPLMRKRYRCLRIQSSSYGVIEGPTSPIHLRIGDVDPTAPHPALKSATVRRVSGSRIGE